jgi:hypothetical protein
VDYGNVQVTTADYADDAGESFDASDETRVQSFSLLSGMTVFSWQVWSLQAGARFNLDR